MKASELVAALQSMIAEHGDRDVYTYADGAWADPEPSVISDRDARCPRDWAAIEPGSFGL